MRLPELMAAREMTAYRVAQLSGGRITMSTAYRLAKTGGHMEYFEAKMLAALCDIFGVTPGELLTRDDEPGYRPPSEKPAVRKRKGKG